MNDFDETMKDIKESLITRIQMQEKEIERLTEELDKTRLSELNKEYRISKAIEYIETHQLNFKKGITTFGSERLSMEERKLIDILDGDSNVS